MSAISHFAIAVVPESGPSSTRAAAEVRMEAVLTNGEPLVLIDDRGFDAPGTWSSWTREELEQHAREVVGPDEPFDDITFEQMRTSHWTSLAEQLAAAGISVHADELSQLTTVVEIPTAVLDQLHT
jgi:hypothetical protein